MATKAELEQQVADLTAANEMLEAQVKSVRTQLEEKVETIKGMSQKVAYAYADGELPKLRAQIEELQGAALGLGDQKLTVAERLAAIVGAERVDAAAEVVLAEAGDVTIEDELSDDEWGDAIAHVLLAPERQADENAQIHETGVMAAEVERLRIKVDDLQNRLVRAQGKLKGQQAAAAGTMHGSIDALPSVVS